MGTSEHAVTSANDKTEISINKREISISKLEKIHGISKKTAEAMYEIGIRSYTDLAKYLNDHTPEEISEKLKEHGVKRPPGQIDKDWIKKAEKLSRNEALFTVYFDVLDENDQPVQYTTVYDERNGGEDKDFEGSKTSQWVNWIVDRPD
ncbi:MAG: hypothetical protein JSV68_09150, partial [Anaerolineaceae bacterium]